MKLVLACVKVGLGFGVCVVGMLGVGLVVFALIATIGAMCGVLVGAAVRAACLLGVC